jgi:hypothetical protein
VGKVFPVCNGEGLAPDLSGRQTQPESSFYVRSSSVGNRNKVMCPIQLLELFQIWEGKLKSINCNLDESMTLLHLHLQSSRER